MATLEDAVHGHMAATSGVTALVSTRIFRVGSVPSSVAATESYLSYQRIDTQRTEHQTAADSIADARVQINCFSPTATGAKALADAVRACWKNVSGQVGAAGNKITVQTARVRDETHDYIEPHDGGQVGKHRYIVDVLVWYSE